MNFASVYPLYVAKAEGKGRKKSEVDAVICWLTGYNQRQLEGQLKKQKDIESFFKEAPKLNPSRTLIKGVVCGVRVEDIAALLGRDVRAITELLALSEAPRSLDAGDARGEEAFTLADTVASDDEHGDPTDVTQTHEVARLLDQWVHALDAREREVLEGRYGLRDREPETLEVLSVRLGLTRERVRQIQNEALAKMRRQLIRSGVGRDALF